MLLLRGLGRANTCLQKTMHWALVVKENSVTPVSWLLRHIRSRVQSRLTDTHLFQGGKRFGQRMFEICGNPPPGSIPAGESYTSHSSVDVSEDELDDPYDADEDYPSVNTLGSTMRMQVSTTIADTFEEPPYQEGGVFWDLIDRLRAETKFTNTEIANEGVYNNRVAALPCCRGDRD